MTPIVLDLAGIRARAEAAGLEPLEAQGMYFQVKGDTFSRVSCYMKRGIESAAFLAAHIASADPPTVIAMCDVIERQAGEIERLKAAILPFIEGLHANHTLYAHVGPDEKLRPGVGDGTRLYAEARCWRTLASALGREPPERALFDKEPSP